MEKLDLKKLSQAILNTKNKVQFCASVCAGELGEDEIDGLSHILEECCEEMEQAANTVDLLRPADYAMQRKGRSLNFGGGLVSVSAVPPKNTTKRLTN